ncbi:MAG: class I SAM-dependent methyltransferase [Actinomycetota bacterium]|nr:class I SAM-dependent methyltransferase [Actinomycetota bacterium]
MSFAVPAEAYDRYMGRYSRGSLRRWSRISLGLRRVSAVLEVGCGPGALTSELAGRAGAERVAAVDPSPGFVLACSERVPGADVRDAPAEQLPWPDDSFDAVVSQLVVSFLGDADAGLREMRRVGRNGGSITACTWDLRR